MPLFPFMFCKIVYMFGDSTGVAKEKKVIFYTVLFSINFITWCCSYTLKKLINILGFSVRFPFIISSFGKGLFHSVLYILE